jgi:CheY-like chemotaxis protein
MEESFSIPSLYAAQKDIDLAYFLDDDLPSSIVSSKRKVTEILSIVLEGAVLSTGKGDISARVTGALEGSLWRLRFSFHGASSEANPPHAARRLCESLGGEFYPSSALEPGTFLAFSIRVAARQEPPTLFQPLLGKIVFLADERPGSRNMAAGLLRRWGAACVPFSAPREALRWLLEGRPADLAVLDERFPGWAGATLAERLPHLPGRSGLPLLLLAPPGDARPAPSGKNLLGRLTKPIRQSALHALLQPLSGPSSASVPAPPPSAAFPLRILIAEDNPINRRVLLRMIQRLGHEADLVETGVQAMEALTAREYQLILMDLHMPGMNGIPAAERIRRRLPKGQGPRIIAITGDTSEDTRRQCEQAGMDGFLTKPVQIGPLKAALQQIERENLKIPLAQKGTAPPRRTQGGAWIFELGSRGEPRLPSSACNGDLVAAAEPGRCAGASAGVGRGRL